MSTALLERPADWAELREEPGNHPGRLRLKVTDTSGNNQLGLIWGFRSRYYTTGVGGALFYEAEALTAVNGAAVTGLSGASGGHVMQINSLPTGSWVSMLATTISSGSQPLTHQGSYRVWARVYSSTGAPQLQFLWGVGSLSAPVTNDPVTLPGSGAFYLLDLGEIRIDPPPIGTAEWFGAIQAYSAAGGDSVSIDCLYFQPLDDGAGQLTYVNVPPASSIAASASPATIADDSSTGTVAWTDPSGAANPPTYASVTLTGYQDSHYLKATNFGFAIPSGATIQGIQVEFSCDSAGYPAIAQVSHVRLVKAGTIQTFDEATNTIIPYTWVNQAYGGSINLWAGTWAASDINNSGFGAVIAVNGGVGTVEALITAISITVWYTLASGFTVSQDAVVYADETCEVRYDGMYREGPSSGPYGPVSQVVGDLGRIPPSGLEGRPCQLFVKPTRGDFNTLPDSGLDAFTVQAVYRPSWIFRP